MANTTLHVIGEDVLRHFEKVVFALQSKASKQDELTDELLFSLDDVLSEKERFQLWAANLGLYATGDRSLDYRIRDSPSVKEYTNQLLDELREDLVDGKSMSEAGNGGKY